MDDSVLGAVEVEATLPATEEKVSFTHNQLEPLAGFLGAHAKADSPKLELIAEFLKGDKTDFTDIDMLQALRHLESRLGAPTLGERRLDAVYRYVKLQSQIDELSHARDAILR